MPGQPGSETRVRTHALATRWSPAEYARLGEIAAYSGCSRAEVLRRLVARDHCNIIPSRELSSNVRRLGNNIDQLVRQTYAGASIRPEALAALYKEMLAALIELRR